MRITGGEARGIVLRTAKNSAVRPATDRLRESVFSSLGERVQQATFLDLFAGSGAYGLEAWSRGAASGIFIEKNRASVAVLKENIRSVARSLGQAAEALAVVQTDVLRWRPGEPIAADLIFVDPPYEGVERFAKQLFPKLSEWLKPGGVLVFEMPGEMELQEPGWICRKRLGKGRHQPSCCLFERTDGAELIR